MIERLLDKYGALGLVFGVLVGGLLLLPFIFGEETRSGASARECLPGDSETWIPAEGLTCISTRPPTLAGSYQEDFVSYQVSQEKVAEHIGLWQHLARGAEHGQGCARRKPLAPPRAWPHVEELEVVTALPPHMDQGCVWVMRETGWFYVQIQWGH